MAKSRDYCFTINNYTEEHIKLCESIEAAYIVYGKEVGESGTPHLQGYVRFPTPRTMKSVIAKMKGAHIEIKKGTCEQAINYCKKDGDVYERGEAPKTQADKGEANKRRWADAFQAAKEQRYDDIPEDMRVRYYETWKKIRADYAPAPQELERLDNEWLYGPTESGKSTRARRENPGAYVKPAATKWWNGYTGQDVVILDDVGIKFQEYGDELKNWADHYPVEVERKGGVMTVRPKRIIVTSNYRPDEIWTDSRILEPILRRFKVIPVGVAEGPKDFLGHYNKKGYL